MALMGCNQARFASMAGQVTLDGKPLKDAEVQFIPDPKQDVQGPPISAYTDEDGRFTIVATEATGVLIGRNRVCINDATVMMPGTGVDAESGASIEPATAKSTVRRSRIPLIYTDVNRTPFRAIDIKPGVQTRDFALQGDQ
jgi:hypothetical protein